jgi:hypothetical protein
VRAAHPQRDHRGEVERSDPGHHAERLAHREHVDPRPGAFGIFALEQVGDGADELDHFQPALHIALGIGDHLAVFGRKGVGELVHVALDQALEFEHHAGAALRVERGPFRLHAGGEGHGLVHVGFAGQADLGLNFAGVGIENVALAARGGGNGGTVQEMVDLAHGKLSSGKGMPACIPCANILILAFSPNRLCRFAGTPCAFANGTI